MRKHMQECHPKLKIDIPTESTSGRQAYYYNGFEAPKVKTRQEITKISKEQQYLFNPRDIIDEMCNFVLSNIGKTVIRCQTKIVSKNQKHQHLKMVHGKYWCIDC